MNWRELQAGHYRAAGRCGFALLFNEQNVNGECMGCNGFDQDHLIGYRKGLDARHGKGTAEKLDAMYNEANFKGKTTKEWTESEYEEKIYYYIGEIDKIKKLGVV